MQVEEREGWEGGRGGVSRHMDRGAVGCMAACGTTMMLLWVNGCHGFCKHSSFHGNIGLQHVERDGSCL